MSNFLENVLSSNLFADAKVDENATYTVDNLAKALDLSASPISIAISVFSVIGTIVIALSVLPQTIKTVKNKDTANLSLLLFLLTGIATFFLTLYGIGLVTVPQNAQGFLVYPKTMFNVQQGEGTVSAYAFNRAEWVAGYLVPGIFLIAGEAFCSATSFVVTFVKLANKIKAKKAGLSEAEYYENHVKPFLMAKGVK